MKNVFEAARSPIISNHWKSSARSFPKIGSLCALAFALLLGGCSHTTTGARFSYPPNAKPGTAEYFLFCNCDGAARKRFVDYTEKKIRLRIEDKSMAALLQRSYAIQAADVNFQVKWPSEDSLRVLVYDFDEGYSGYSPDWATHHPQMLMVLSFVRDSSTGQFVEAPLTSDVIDEITKLKSTSAAP